MQQFQSSKALFRRQTKLRAYQCLRQYWTFASFIRLVFIVHHTLIHHHFSSSVTKHSSNKAENLFISGVCVCFVYLYWHRLRHNNHPGILFLQHWICLSFRVFLLLWPLFTTRCDVHKKTSNLNWKREIFFNRKKTFESKYLWIVIYHWHISLLFAV